MTACNWKSAFTVIAGVCFIAVFLIPNRAYPWGAAAHKLINLKAVIHLPHSMDAIIADSLFYQAHASDPDKRKNPNDTAFFAEDTRHYIDIDYYPDFYNFPHNLDSAVMRYGWNTVKNNGTLPWAIIMVMDSLTARLARGDKAASDSSMSDLGHYVADAHQPLHCTKNYDGGSTGNSGIHSRYETGMINSYQALLFVHPDSIYYVASPANFIFDYIYRSYAMVDSMLAADTYAKNASGWNGSGSAPAGYYTALWEKTGAFTESLIQSATRDLACLWYTAYLNSKALAARVHDPVPQIFKLDQNYPNPFNPVTNIAFYLPEESRISVRIFNTLGELVATLADNGIFPSGSNVIEWDASSFSSGIYFYRLETHGNVRTMKMVLLK